VALDNFQNMAFADQTGDATLTSFTFKVGTGNETYDSLTFSVNAASASALSLDSNAIDTAANAETASAAVSAAIDTLNESRSVVGAAQNRLSFAAQNLASAIENAEAARSTLLDLDVAKEITTFTSKQVLLQTGIAMLAQANQMPQNLLRLFQ
jgi:flagellin